MKKSRFTEEQMIGFLKQAEAGMPIKELLAEAHLDMHAFKSVLGRYGSRPRWSSPAT